MLSNRGCCCFPWVVTCGIALLLSVSGVGLHGMFTLSSLCSFGVKVMDFQVNPRRCGTINRKHTSPAFQPPLPPTEAGTLAQPGAEQHSQGAVAETSPAGAAFAPSAGTAEQLPSPGNEDVR